MHSCQYGHQHTAWPVQHADSCLRHAASA
jgi:hypothetical protein